jgi:hypothetical protein
MQEFKDPRVRMVLTVRLALKGRLLSARMLTTPRFSGATR